MFCMAVVVNVFFMSILLQIAVGYISPCLAPLHKLFLAILTLGNRILSAVFRAFRIFRCPFISFFFSSRRSHINLADNDTDTEETELSEQAMQQIAKEEQLIEELVVNRLKVHR